MSRSATRRLLLLIVLGIVVMLALLAFVDLDELGAAFAGFTWAYIPLILGLTLVNYVFRFFKWEYYLRQLGIRLRVGKSVLIFLSGMTMSMTPARLGEVFKSYLIKQDDGTEMSRSIPIVFAERATDVIGLTLLAGIGLASFRYGQGLLLASLLIVAALVLLIRQRDLCTRLLGLVARVRVVRRYADNLNTMYLSAYHLFSWRSLLIAIGLSVTSWFFECVALYFVIGGFGWEPSLLESTFVFSFSSVAGALSMLPGGLGVAEGSIAGLLVLQGLPVALSVAATIVIRVCTLWFGMTIGAVALAIFARTMGSETKEVEA